MDRIIFTGACAFLNVSNDKDTIGPSVIAIRAESDHPEHQHISFIAFDLTRTELADKTGFFTLQKASNFGVLALNGVFPKAQDKRRSFELQIVGNPPGTPIPDPSFSKSVVNKDDYWPAAANRWNRAFAPAPGGGRPSKDAVTFHMQLGTGSISAGKLLDDQWTMRIVGGPHDGEDTPPANYAREVIYSGFPHDGDGLTIVMKDFDTGEERVLVFTPRNGAPDVKLWIGNNIMEDLDDVLRGTQPKHIDITEAEHFAHLNEIADPALGAGPIPKLVPKPPGAGLETFDGGGLSDGFCGPIKP
jgi:hypothetical protein